MTKRVPKCSANIHGDYCQILPEFSSVFHSNISRLDISEKKSFVQLLIVQYFQFMDWLQICKIICEVGWRGISGLNGCR